MEVPKLFISYCWTNPAHEQWVLDLATQLRGSGVDVLLDKWDLKEGHDAVAFMEKMVNDPEIKKVAIIADKAYVKKANDRTGGVGTETQIISKEIYENQEQDKFVVIVSERDENGGPYLPTYYKSRLYIDLSEAGNYSENYEKLLRWIFNKPLYPKPCIGKKPSFLDEDVAVSLQTTPMFKRALDAIKNDRNNANVALEEYLNMFAENLEIFRIGKYDREFDDAVIKSIESFLPYRNEIIQVFITISQYSPDEEKINKLHRFFERLIQYLYPSQHIKQRYEWDFDNFKFITHELFLYVVAILIKYERFAQANYLLEQGYYYSEPGLDNMKSFVVFGQYIESLKYRNDRLSLRRISLRADILKERCSGIGIDFRYLLQADFILFMRAEIMEVQNNFGWWPETLIYLCNSNSPFELFARATSKKYFDKIKCLLTINTPEDLKDLLADYRMGKKRLPEWEIGSFNPSILLGYERLAKSP